jgi:hypothetical protein
MNEALSVLKKSTNSATSSGRPNLPIGCFAARASLMSPDGLV